VRDVSGLGGRAGRASFEGFNMVHDFLFLRSFNCAGRPTNYALHPRHNIPICGVMPHARALSSCFETLTPLIWE
jgi:hypothetical protein